MEKFIYVVKMSRDQHLWVWVREGGTKENFPSFSNECRPVPYNLLYIYLTISA